MMHGYGMMGNMEMMGPGMWIFMLLLWGAAIFGLVCLVRWTYLHFHHGDGKK